ncbi:MAG: hypothetical protein BWY70_02023 [Bacteroidetes bacterium ADurb.Bin408]|nr:MAG: hypothetical protein BWY70_02023 [Bacteroidetes bacterium ADurb.Bin408]
MTLLTVIIILVCTGTITITSGFLENGLPMPKKFILSDRFQNGKLYRNTALIEPAEVILKLFYPLKHSSTVFPTNYLLFGKVAPESVFLPGPLMWYRMLICGFSMRRFGTLMLIINGNTRHLKNLPIHSYTKPT